MSLFIQAALGTLFALTLYEVQDEVYDDDLEESLFESRRVLLVLAFGTGAAFILSLLLG